MGEVPPDATAGSKVSSLLSSWVLVIVSPALIATPLSLMTPAAAPGRVVILTPAKALAGLSLESVMPSEKSVVRKV